MGTITRRIFIGRAILGGSAIIAPGVTLITQAQQPERPAPLKPEIVKEFVGVCHGKFDRAKEMLENDHLLLHSSWDLGGGDFESGIEGAGHVGNKEIATYLLGKGARYNLHLACMLGHLDTVKQILGSYPHLLNSKGPHGFTPLHHANKGEEDALAVVEYLQSLGAKETRLNFWAKA